jgi:hypothetical protein
MSIKLKESDRRKKKFRKVKKKETTKKLSKDKKEMYSEKYDANCS